MNVLIYVLSLSIWTINCLNTSQSDGSSTTAGAKPLETMETKMDNFKRHLLIIIIGVMIVAFVFTCFCFLHYNCMNEDAHKAGTVKKESIEDKSIWPSKISLSESKTENLCSREKQSILSSIEKLSGPSSPEKLSIPSSAEKLIRPLSARKCRPNRKEKLIRSSTQEKSFFPFCLGKLFRQSSKKKSKSRKPSSPQRFLRSSHLEKSRKTYSLEKSYKVAHAHKIVSQVSASYPDKPVRVPWPARLQSSARPAKSRFLRHPQNQILLSKPSSLRKLVKSPRHRHLKRSISIGKAVLLTKPMLAKTCQYYKEKCLVCKTTSETLVHISEAKKENSGKLFSSSNIKPFPRSFQKLDSRDDVYYDNVSDSDMMTYDSDDSEREIIIICNIRSNNIIPYGTSKK